MKAKIEKTEPVKSKGVKLFYYKCATCGNKCLKECQPNNSVCVCQRPNWKLMINQQAYLASEKDYIHEKGEI